MTRKRFVKLLMASGWSRDRAQAFASNVAISGLSYVDALQDIIDFVLFVADSLRAVCDETIEPHI